MLQELLDVADAALADDAPERQFVAHGDFAHDCAQLATRLANYEMEAQTDSGAGCAVIPVATFELQLLLDCWPTTQQEQVIPTADAISVAAKRVADAGVAMLEGITDAALVDGDLFAGRCCVDIVVGPLEPIGPEAGIVGWTLTITVRL